MRKLFMCLLALMFVFVAVFATAGPFTWKVDPYRVTVYKTGSGPRDHSEYKLKFSNNLSELLDAKMNEQHFIFALFMYKPHLEVTATLMKAGTKYRSGWFSELHHSFYGVSSTENVPDMLVMSGEWLPPIVKAIWEELKDDDYVVLMSYNLISQTINIYLHPRFDRNKMMHTAYRKRLQRVFKRWNYTPFVDKAGGLRENPPKREERQTPPRREERWNPKRGYVA